MMNPFMRRYQSGGSTEPSPNVRQGYGQDVVPIDPKRYEQWLNNLRTDPINPDWSKDRHPYKEYYRKPAPTEIPDHIRGAMGSLGYYLGHHTVDRAMDAYNFRLKGATKDDYDSYLNDTWKPKHYQQLNDILSRYGYSHPGFSIQMQAPGVPREINKERWVGPKGDSLLFLDKGMAYPPSIQWRGPPRDGYSFERDSPEDQQRYKEIQKELDAEVGRIQRNQGKPPEQREPLQGYDRLDEFMRRVPSLPSGPPPPPPAQNPSLGYQSGGYLDPVSPDDFQNRGDMRTERQRTNRPSYPPRAPDGQPYRAEQGGFPPHWWLDPSWSHPENRKPNLESPEYPYRSPFGGWRS